MAECLWSGTELMALGLRFDPPEAAEGFCAGGVSIDSRTLRPGDLFAAIRGEARDGHAFVAAALKSGAAGALVDHAPEGGAEGTLLYADDTLAGLEALGRAARDRAADATRIAVTGSVGKTSTKEALSHVLAGFGIAHASAASYNNLWGVPLTLARMPAGTRYGIFEIGMNHAGEITPLTKQVAPHIAIVTTVEAVHLEHFADVAAIADAKAEIFGGLAPGGTAILNRDNVYFEHLARRASQARPGRILGFGAAEQADIRLLNFMPLTDGSEITALVLGARLTYRLGTSGRHNALNSLAVLAAAVAAGVDVEAAARRLADVPAPSGRGAQTRIEIQGGHLTLVDESYNANPASMRAALSNLGLAHVGPGGRRIAVLGDMLELGPKAAEFHAALAEATAPADIVFTCGPLMKALHDALPTERRGEWAPSSAELAEAVAGRVGPGDVVMIKGSLGSRMKRIVERLRALPAGAAHQTERTP